MSNRKRKRLEREAANKIEAGIKTTKVKAGASSKEPCRVCGRNHAQPCKFLAAGHPDANTSSSSWADSVKGKAWAAIGKSACEFTTRLDGTNFEFNAASGDKKGSRPQHGKRPRSGKYDLLFAMECDDNDCYTVPIALHSAYIDSKLNCRMLIDTGALQANYVNLRTAAWLRAKPGIEIEREQLEDREGGQLSCLVTPVPIGLGGDCNCSAIRSAYSNDLCSSCMVNQLSSDNQNFLGSNSALVQGSKRKFSQKSTSNKKSPVKKNKKVPVKS
jgi:hypothetical protein